MFVWPMICSTDYLIVVSLKSAVCLFLTSLSSSGGMARRLPLVAAVVALLLSLAAGGRFHRRGEPGAGADLASSRPVEFHMLPYQPKEVRLCSVLPYPLRGRQSPFIVNT